jgi:hypothetical protein
MGLQKDMTKETHPNGSFTMTPDPAAFTGEKALHRFAEAFGDKPVTPLKVDLDRDDKGQVRTLAGKQGPYIRLFARAFKHGEKRANGDVVTYDDTLLGSIQQVKVGGRTTLRLNQQLQRRFVRGATPSGPSVAPTVAAAPKPETPAEVSDIVEEGEELPD